MFDKKTFGWIFLIGFTILTWYLYSNNDKIASMISADGITGIFWYFATNVNYLLLLFGLFIVNRETNSINNFFGGMLLIIAIDLVAFPRFSPSGISTDPMLLASFGGILLKKLMSYGMSYGVAYTSTHLIIPILSSFASISLLGYNDLYKKIFKKGV